MTEIILKQILLTYPVNTWSRNRCCTAFRLLAKSCKLDNELNLYSGSYKPKLREIPTPSQLETAVDNLINPAWQFIAGIIATFGLRPHEVFYLNLSRLNESPPILQVDDKFNPNTKTGYRVVIPIYSDWISRWNLTQFRFPNMCYDINTMPNRKLGFKIKSGFTRNKFLYTAYQLRDFYAIYSSVKGIPNDIAARLMGHSLLVHERAYKCHIDSDRLIESYIQATKDG